MTTKPVKEPDIFNRSVLDMSFTLLRKKDPKLALQVRNVLFTVAIARSEESPDNKNSDLFKVNIDSHQIRAIVENLNEVLDESRKLDPTKNTSIFRPILIESIVKEWLNLAAFMFDKLRNENNQSE